MHRRQNPGLQCHCSQAEDLKSTERPPLNSFSVKRVTGKITSLNCHTSVGFSAGLRTAVRARSYGSTLPVPNPGAPRCAKYLPSLLRSVPRALLYWVRPFPAPGQWPRLGQKWGHQPRGPRQLILPMPEQDTSPTGSTRPGPWGTVRSGSPLAFGTPLGLKILLWGALQCSEEQQRGTGPRHPQTSLSSWFGCAPSSTTGVP